MSALRPGLHRALAASMVCLICLIFLATIACNGGCGDDGATAELVFELAPAAVDVGDDGCFAGPVPRPEAVDYLHLSICEYGRVGCEEVRLATIEGEEEPPGLLIETSSRFELDAQLGGGEHRVEAVACIGTEPFARGVADRAQLRSGVTTVRLYRFGQSSCAGPRVVGDDVALPLARGLHEAMALPNGDVLIFGGITGSPALGPTFMAGTRSWEGAPLQRAVEVYRPSEERFLDVGGDDFGRVLFAARLLPSGGDVGPFRIRVVGGFEAEGDAAALRFDARQGFSFYAAPVLPGASATVGNSVDLVYDPRGPTLSVEDASIAGNPRAAANRIGELVPDLPAAVALGITAEEMGTTDSPRPGTSGAYWWLGREGMRVDTAQTLLSARFGHTVSTVPTASGALVWGGNVAEADPAVVQANAGELLRVGESPAPVPGGDPSPLPEPAAMHTATNVMDHSVLVAGGLRVGCSGATCVGRGFNTTYASPPLSMLRFDGVGFVPVPVEMSTPFEPSFLHAAVPLSEGGATSAVALLGGATVSGDSRMSPSDQIVRVGSTAAGGFGTMPLGEVPVDGLLQARWGHAVTPLPGDRLLVTGGLRIGEAGRLAPIPQAEMVSHGPPPSPNPCAAAGMDGGTGILDAGATDPTDAGPAPMDSGPAPMDSGPAPMDSGSAAPDAGVSPVDSGV